MRRLLGGYTVVEVMLFLAISGIIFAGAVAVFGGQEGKTTFEQGMRDFNSQLQKYVDEVGTSVIPGGGQYTCTINGLTGRPQLSAGAGNGQGANTGCIFLGRAIQVVPTQQTVYVYGVIGVQNDKYNEPITSFKAALPTPAFAAGADITDQYSTPFAKVTSSKITTTTGAVSDSDLVGFYNSLQDGFQNSGVGGAQSIFAKGYNFTSSSLASNRSAGVQTCIEEQDANGYDCTNTPTIASWSVCFASTTSSQTALLTASSNPAGITTDVNFTSCS